MEQHSEVKDRTWLGFGALEHFSDGLGRLLLLPFLHRPLLHLRIFCNGKKEGTKTLIIPKMHLFKR